MEIDNLQKCDLSSEVSTHVAATRCPRRNHAKVLCGSLAARNEPVERIYGRQRVVRNEDHVRLHDHVSRMDWASSATFPYLAGRYSSAPRGSSTPHSPRCPSSIASVLLA